MNLPNLPFRYEVNEEDKVVQVFWGQNGQLGRYGVPVLMKRYFPDYEYEFVEDTKKGT